MHEPQIIGEKGSTSSSDQNQKDQTNNQSCGSSQTKRKPNDIIPTGNLPKNTIQTISNKHITLPQSAFPPIDENREKECEECHIDFLRSYLYRNFEVPICDDCRRPNGTHELITRTDAKTKYLLKDCDLDKREPPLRYILKKNPYQSRGDMRLYLKYQVEERALEVHGTEEGLEEEIEKREERRMIKKQKTYDKKMKSLSMQVRSSLYKRGMGKHEHEYGEPVCIDEDKDLYRKECTSCGHQWDYEEL